jgi:hypothetical protein
MNKIFDVAKEKYSNGYNRGYSTGFSKKIDQKTIDRIDYHKEGRYGLIRKNYDAKSNENRTMTGKNPTKTLRKLKRYEEIGYRNGYFDGMKDHLFEYITAELCKQGNCSHSSKCYHCDRIICRDLSLECDSERCQERSLYSAYWNGDLV